MTNFEKFKQSLAELTAPTLGDKLSTLTKDEVNAILAACDTVAYGNEMDLADWFEHAGDARDNTWWEDEFPE